MTKEDFNQFVSMMAQAKNVQDSAYKDFIEIYASKISCDYVKYEQLFVNRRMTTMINISRWMDQHILEIKVTIRRDSEKRKGVIPVEQDDIVINRISENIINFKDVEQEAISMAQKLGWL